MSNNFQSNMNLNVPQALDVPTGATGVFMTIEVAPVRMRGDGTNPTVSTGHLLPVGLPE